MIVFNRLGLPTRTITTSDGGKKLIYKYFTMGMFLTPYKSRVTYRTNKDAPGKREGLILRGGVNTATYLSKIAVCIIFNFWININQLS